MTRQGLSELHDSHRKYPADLPSSCRAPKCGVGETRGRKGEGRGEHNCNELLRNQNLNIRRLIRESYFLFLFFCFFFFFGLGAIKRNGEKTLSH